MKRLLPMFLIVAGSLFASAAYSQVYVHARINLPVPPLPPIPHVNVYAQTVPPVVYENYSQPSAQYYPEYGRERVVIAEPGYGYRHDNYGRGYRYERDHYRDRRYDDYREHRSYDRERRNW